MINRAPAVHLAASLAVALLVVGPPALGQADELADALQTIEDLTLLGTLQLDDYQLTDLITAVENTVALLAGQQQQEDAVLETMAETLRQAREALVLGRVIPPETAKMLEQAEQDEAQRAAEFQQQLDRQIDAVRDLLHPRQIALIEWRSAEERAQVGVESRDPRTEAVFGMTLRTVDEVRSLLYPERYWERLDIAAAYLTTFVPPGTPAYNRLYRRVVDVFERVIRTPPQEYPRARLASAEELLRLVGAMPQQAETQRPITREALSRVLTKPGTIDLLREMVEAHQKRALRR